VRVDVAAPRQQESVAQARDQENLQEKVGVGDERRRAEEALAPSIPEAQIPRIQASEPATITTA